MPSVYSAALVLLGVQVPQSGPPHAAPRLGPDPIVHLFLTAKENPNLPDVTVGVSRVVLVAAGGDRIVFRAKPARIVHLRALASAEGGDVYEFLSRNVVPYAVYDGVRIELEPAVTVGQGGGKDAVQAKFSETKFGYRTLMIPFEAPQRFDKNRNLSIVFDLTKWKLIGTSIKVETQTDPDTNYVTQLGMTARDKVAAQDVAEQIPLTLLGFVTGPIGRPPGPLTGVRQEGWILPVRFPATRPSRGNIVQFTGKFDLVGDAFNATEMKMVVPEKRAPRPSNPPSKTKPTS